MHILEKYYDLLTEIKIANNEIVKIDPDKAYTVVYLIDGRMSNQSTGILRGVKGEPNLIVSIPLDADNVNLANIIETNNITKITEYSFDAHFETFNNWIGVEVAERSRIDLRVKFTTGENIVSVEQGNTYNIGYVSKEDGTINYITGVGTVKNIIRSTAREAMPQHINHFTNDMDYILVVKFKDQDSLTSINVIDIRNITLYYTIEESATEGKPDTSTLCDLIKIITDEDRHGGDYIQHTFGRLMDAMGNAYKVLNNVSNNKGCQCDVDIVYENLKDAYDGLLLKADEKDLITYDADTNTLYCDESHCQVSIEGLKESNAGFNRIRFYTNFGTEREIVAPGGLNVYWSHYGNNVYESLDKSNDVKFNGFYKQPFYLICMEANLGDVYLGYKAIKTIQGEDGVTVYKPNTVKASFVKSNIKSLYSGGFGMGYLASGNTVNIVSCNVGTVYGGGYIPVDLANNDKLINDRSVRLSINNSNIEKLYAGGENNHSDMTELHINGSNVNTLYMTGKDYNTTYGAAAVIENSMITQIEYIAKLATSHSVLCQLKSTSVYRVVLGCNGASGTFITGDPNENNADNKLRLIIQEGTRIEELMLGGNGVSKIDKKYVDVIRPYSIVRNDSDDLIPDYLQ